MIATVKIIPFAVGGALVEKAAARVKAPDTIRVHPFRDGPEGRDHPDPGEGHEGLRPRQDLRRSPRHGLQELHAELVDETSTDHAVAAVRGDPRSLPWPTWC
jgi:hypothetical protein